MPYLSHIALLCLLLLLISSGDRPAVLTPLNESTRMAHVSMQTSPAPAPVLPQRTPERAPERGRGNSDNTLRFLIHGADLQQAISEKQRRLLSEYATQQGKEPVWVSVEQPWQRLAWLHEDLADVVVSSHASLDKAMGEQLRYTLPWAVVRQYVIGRKDTGKIRSMRDLATRAVAIKASSPLWAEVKRLLDAHPTMAVNVVPEKMHATDMLARVNTGEYDLIITDSLSTADLLNQFSDVDVLFDFAETESMVWAVQADAAELQDSLNRFLHKKHLQHHAPPVYKFDLPELREKHILRLITYHSPVNYFLHNGKLKGFEYELIRRFAEKNKMRLDVVVADSIEQMQALLLAGKGDVIAASLPAHSYPENLPLAMTQAYSYTAPVLVGRDDDKAVVSLAGLDNRRIMLSKESPYYPFLNKLNTNHAYDLRWDKPQATTESTLFRVARGMYDLTVIGSHELASQFSRHLNLKAHFVLSDPLPQTWYVREENTQLLAALNDFIAEHYRKGMYNVLYARYIDKPAAVKGNFRLLAGVQALSPYDDIVNEYADDYHFDWRLIVAQMYQESQFNPQAVSSSGAEGLMQLIPDTAELMGISDVNNPEESIRGGVRYLDYLRSQFEPQLLLADRTWFTLAAYNAGYGRVNRARKLATEMGLDRNKWFDNVELAMLRLAKPYRSKGKLVRDCRCGQTVVYVRDIKILYNNYVRLTESVKAAAR